MAKNYTSKRGVVIVTDLEAENFTATVFFTTYVEDDVTEGRCIVLTPQSGDGKFDLQRVGNDALEQGHFIENMLGKLVVTWNGSEPVVKTDPEDTYWDIRARDLLHEAHRSKAS